MYICMRAVAGGMALIGSALVFSLRKLAAAYVVYGVNVAVN